MATKFEIRTDSHEIRLDNRHPITLTADQVFEDYRMSSCQDSHIRESYDTLDEAQAEFQAHWSNWGSTRRMEGNGTRYLYCEFAWIEENRYDDDGEFDQGGWDYDVSAEGYSDERRYRVLPEYQDRWTNVPGECIVTESEIERLAREWGVDEDELMEQVEEG